jgi:hypothetical protein
MAKNTIKSKKKIAEPGKTYLGIVEDNNDPFRQCRVRARVVDVFDGKDAKNNYVIKTEDLPWATPWKDMNGNASNVPDKGKVVLVVFENGKEDNPEYICANHFNINLEKKMDALSQEDYISMKALIFDHKTQVYVNDSEGLKMDHKFNNINIKSEAININLKDNFGKVNIGTEKATQRAILGDTFTNWLDELLNIFQSNTALLGNFGAPIVAAPALLSHIQLYKSIKDPKILSKNIYLVDNEDVKTLDRIAEPIIGDEWQSTIEENDITSKEEIDYAATPGSTTTTFDTPPPGETPPGPTASNADGTPKTKEEQKPKKADPHPDTKIIKQLLSNKNYNLYTEKNQLNIVGIRNQCMKPKDMYTDTFGDRLYVMYTDENGEEKLEKFEFSTVPGADFTLTQQMIDDASKSLNAQQLTMLNGYLDKKISSKMFTAITGKEGLPILAPSQYLDTYELMQEGCLKSKDGAAQLIWLDKEFDKPEFLPTDPSRPPVTVRTTYFAKGFPGGKSVGHYGLNGDQCFASKSEMDQFISLCNAHVTEHGNSFTYTLATRKDWDEATKNAMGNKNDPEEKPEKAKDAPEPKTEKPTELKNDMEVEAFKTWAAANGTTLSKGSTWKEEESMAWERFKEKYNGFIVQSTDSDLKLAQANILPFGSPDTLDGKPILKSLFSNNKYKLILMEGREMEIIDNSKGTTYLKATYEDGCKVITIKEVMDTAAAALFPAGKKLKDTSAWANITSLGQ